MDQLQWDRTEFGVKELAISRNITLCIKYDKTGQYILLLLMSGHGGQVQAISGCQMRHSCLQEFIYCCSPADSYSKYSHQHHIISYTNMIYDMFVNCNWVDTRWQWYSTHLHTNSTQNDTRKQNIQKGTYIAIRIYKLNNKNTQT